MSDKKELGKMTPAEQEKELGGDLSKVRAAVSELAAIPPTSANPSKVEPKLDSTPGDKTPEPDKKAEEGEAKAPEPKAPTAEELKAELERERAIADKRVRDAQAEMHRKTAEAAELKKKLSEATEPQLLKDSPELKDAIRHVVGIDDKAETPANPSPDRAGTFNSIVAQIHPGYDLDSAVKDPEFVKAFREFGGRNGITSENYVEHPVEVARFITDWRLNETGRKSAAERDAAVKAAVEAERAAHVRKQRELDMQGGIPTGGKGMTPQAPPGEEAALLRGQNEYRTDGLRGVRAEVERIKAGH